MNEPPTQRPNAPGSPQPAIARRRLPRAGAVLVLLGAVLLGGKVWYSSTRPPPECRGALICERGAFERACREARTQPDPLSAAALLGNPAQERCDDARKTCEIEILGGPGPRHDGCVVRYEQGTGRILETRHYAW